MFGCKFYNKKTVTFFKIKRLNWRTQIWRNFTWYSYRMSYQYQVVKTFNYQKTIRCFVSQLDALTRDYDMKGFKIPRQIRILEWGWKHAVLHYTFQWSALWMRTSTPIFHVENCNVDFQIICMYHLNVNLPFNTFCTFWPIYSVGEAIQAIGFQSNFQRATKTSNDSWSWLEKLTSINM